jgi:rubrerythrin
MEYIEEELLEIIESAISAEKASQERYKIAEKLARCEESRKLFQDLQKEEKIHEEKLQKKFYEIKKALGLKVVKSEK